MASKEKKEKKDRKPREVKPFLTRLHKQIDGFEKKAKLLGASLRRTGKSIGVTIDLAGFLAAARAAIADLPADFKPAGGPARSTLTVGAEVQISADRIAEYRDLLPEPVLMGKWKITSMPATSNKVAVVSLTPGHETQGFVFPSQRDIHLHGQPRKPRAKKGEGAKKAA